MIIFDNETTGLIKNKSFPLNHQPKIIEFGGIKVDDETLEEIDRIDVLINPGTKLPPIITKITGIKDSDLASRGSFSEYYETIADFFMGEKTMVAHNLSLDKNMLMFDFRRIGKASFFPWPKNQVCTVELSKHLNDGKFINLEKLYKMAYDKDAKQTHRATGDCEILLDCVRWLRSEHELI